MYVTSTAIVTFVLPLFSARLISVYLTAKTVSDGVAVGLGELVIGGVYVGIVFVHSGGVFGEAGTETLLF